MRKPHEIEPGDDIVEIDATSLENDIDFAAEASPTGGRIPRHIEVVSGSSLIIKCVALKAEADERTLTVSAGWQRVLNVSHLIKESNCVVQVTL